MNSYTMNHDSVDFEEGSEIINGADEFAINHELSDSADFSRSGYDEISDQSFEIVSKILSPEPPVTDVEIKREYFNLRSAIVQEKKILSSKKIMKTFEIRTLEAKIDELIAENSKLKATIEDLEKALHSYSKLPLAGLHTFPKSGGKRKTKRKKKSRRR
jgi:hypothetical protein